MFVVFMSQPDFACNPHALWKYIIEKTDFETAWIVKRVVHYESLTKRGIRCAVYDTVEANRFIDSADIIIANSYTFLNINKRGDQLLVNLWHGSGVKAHDYYDHNLNPRHAIKLKNYFEKVDLMCVHSLDDRFKLSAMLHYDLRKMYVTGQPRLDCVINSDGKDKIVRLLGQQMTRYDKLIFFAPSYRSNMSCHAGKIYSDNIFRLDDFDNEQLDAFLTKYNAALIYKLHPIEQTAFSGREFIMSDHCYELTDQMLFEYDIRYDEILNAFDIMVSDYSSIAYDYLLLDRPIVYLVPDFDEYKKAKGFVFNNIDAYMPGDKVQDFSGLLDALVEAFDHSDKYVSERKNVIDNRFDYIDGKSTERCFKQIMEYQKISENYVPYQSAAETVMPTIAEHIERVLPSGDVLIVDSRKKYDREELLKRIELAKNVYYITSEIPSKFRSVSAQNSYRIIDLELYETLCKMRNVHIAYITGGVDYSLFSSSNEAAKKSRRRIGFAGSIDNRIYFSMVQCICEEFHDCEIIFAGTIIGDYPAWLGGFDNLTYIEATYDELPAIIETFDVAILPFFGGHQKLVPTELFQYLACGKSVVTSNMPNLPECCAIYKGASVAEVVENIHLVLSDSSNLENAMAAREVAQKYDWHNVVEKMLKNQYDNDCESEE